MQASTPFPQPQTDTGRWEQENQRLLQLIGRAKAGDARAFEELYDRTAPWLLSRIRRLVDDGQAEDVLAEVFLQVWKSLSSYDAGRAGPGAWLAMIARSRALDHLRREQRRPGGAGCASSCDESADAEAATQAHEDGPEQAFSRSQQSRLAKLSLACLNSRERLVLGLAYFRECTQLEIATMTGMPLGTVKSLMTRSQQKLRTYFGLDAPQASP